MSEAQPPSTDRMGRRERTAQERGADHAAIHKLTDELLPALIAKLGATGLGELEVREDAWRVRLRRPADGAPTTHRDRKRDRADRERAERDGPGADRHADRHADRSTERTDRPTARSASRSVATSPAVGIYRPRPDLAAGTRVRSGDRLGAVDMLGVAQEVVAPVDGILGASLAETGDAVEYGQELLVIEFAPAAGS
ncbi:acetyl-CoA carboxylase biotin carboxyl carrier protein [soil metagenome]